jgi:uncharacterized protein (DUF983 family)
MELWDLPRDKRARFLLGLRRALTRRCPYCGSPGIYSGYFTLRERCPTCGVVFEREEGYFLGAYAVNLIVAEFLGIGIAIFLILRTDLRHMDVMWQVLVAMLLAGGLPILFFPYSRGIWMALDLTLHPPGEVIERQLRGNLSHWESTHRH